MNTCWKKPWIWILGWPTFEGNATLQFWNSSVFFHPVAWRINSQREVANKKFVPLNRFQANCIGRETHLLLLKGSAAADCRDAGRANTAPAAPESEADLRRGAHLRAAALLPGDIPRLSIVYPLTVNFKFVQLRFHKIFLLSNRNNHKFFNQIV